MHKDALAIILITLILVIIGVIVSFSVEGVEKSVKNFLFKEIILLVIGFSISICLVFVDYHNIFKPNKLFFISFLCIASLILVLIIGEEVKGARRWIVLPGGFFFQPSEFTKIVVLLNIVWYLTRFQHQLKRFTFGIVIPLGLGGLYAGLIYLEKDQGIPMVIMVTLLCVMIVAGVRLMYIAFGGVLLAILSVLAIVSEPHRIDRVKYTIWPELDPMGKGWHILQSLVCYYRGGLWGVGFGAGEQKLGYLPAPHRDFPFSLIAEEMGLIGALVVVLLFFLFSLYGFEIARKAPDRLGALLALGITCIITIQAVVMMMVNLGLLPIKGMCLPLISSGGSSFVSTMIMIAILVNIGTQEVRQSKEKQLLTIPLMISNNTY